MASSVVPVLNVLCPRVLNDVECTVCQAGQLCKQQNATMADLEARVQNMVFCWLSARHKCLWKNMQRLAIVSFRGSCRICRISADSKLTRYPSQHIRAVDVRVSKSVCSQRATTRAPRTSKPRTLRWSACVLALPVAIPDSRARSCSVEVM